MSDGWRALSANYWPLTGACFVAFVGVLAISIVPLIGGLASVFLAPIYSSLLMMGVRSARGQRVEFSDSFACFGPKYWLLLATHLLISVASMIVLTPLLLPSFIGIPMLGIGIEQSNNALAVGGGVLLSIGLLLLIIASTYLTARIWTAPMLYYDAPAGSLEFFDTFKLAWRRTAADHLTLFSLFLVVQLINLALALLLCVPLFMLGMPLTLCVLGVAYARLFPLADAATACPSCGYAISGLESPICPECGINFRHGRAAPPTAH